MRTFVAATSMVMLLASLPFLALAQATGTITGVATDQSELVLPGVTIEITSVATNQTRRAVTGSDGFYTVPLLQPGAYVVKASLAGFQTTVRQGVQVTVESTTRVDLRLGVASLQEAITIIDEPPLVETSNSHLGIVVDGKKIVELPLNGRNFTQLGTLLPGVVAPPGALGGAAGDATPGGFGAATSGFSVNGMRNQSNNFLLDGASNNDTFNTGFVNRPPPDAIQEFKILTHSYSAEYGRNAGSVVNVVTRAGSNAFRGAAWEFNRDHALQARNFFAPVDQPKPKLKQNQFGGSLGGPLVRNRLFGFGYYEGYRNTSGSTTNIVVLTDAERGGDFSGSAGLRDPLTGLPFTGGVIPSGRLDAAALKLVNDFLPHANNGSNRYIASPDARDERDQFGVRFDYQITNNHSVLGRYLRTNTDARTPATTRPIGGVALATLQDWMFSDTFVFNPNTLNVVRFSYNRIGANPAVTSGLLNSDYSINVPHNLASAQGLANIVVTGFFSLGDVQQPFVDRVNEVFQFTDDVTWVKGVHAMKMGFDVRKEHMVIAFVNRPNGDYTFTGSTTQRSGNAAADFLLGLPAQFRRTTANTVQDGTGWLYAGYVQDDFRPWPRLTINAGLRYELPLPFVDKNDALNSFRPGQQSTRFPQAPAGLVYPGDDGVPRGTYDTDTNNFSPRTGLAWDPTGSGRSSVRAAWGIFYDALAGQGDFFQNGVLAPPFTPLLEVNAPPAALTLRDPLNVVSGGAAGFPPGLTFIGWGSDFTTPHAHHFNLTMQQQVAERLVGEVGYVGSRGFHLPIFMEVNPGVYAPGQTIVGARLFPAFALVRPTFSAAKSWYDSLQASLRIRAHGVNLLASYTLGRAQDHVSGLNIGGEQRPVLPVEIGDDASVERALTFEKGDALFDVRHRFVVSFSAELPTPRQSGALLRHLAGGWQVNGIVQTQSGFPTTVFDPSLSIRYLTNRPNQTCDPNAGAPHTVEQWFTTACFARRALADTAEPGTTPRNSVRGPGFARTDLSLFKNVDLAGTHSLQLRLEAFNLWNQTRFGQPGNQVGTANFGRITTAEDGRIMQLAVKYNF
jgi:outer membrane receptor protein involved in Fe transport